MNELLSYLPAEKWTSRETIRLVMREVIPTPKLHSKEYRMVWRGLIDYLLTVRYHAICYDENLEESWDKHTSNLVIPDRECNENIAAMWTRTKRIFLLPWEKP